MPRGRTRGVRDAPTRAPSAHPVPGSPLSSLTRFPTPRLRPPPPLARKPLSEARVWLSSLRGFGAVRKVSRPRALKRNWRCRSLLTPAAKMPGQVLLSFPQGVCVCVWNGPDLPFRYQPVPERVGRRSGKWRSGPPHSWRVPASSVCRPAGHDSQGGEAGSGHLPAAHSSSRAVTFHPSIRQQALE